MAFYIVHRHKVCLVDFVDLICILCSWWEGFGSSSLATHPWVSVVVLFPSLHVVVYWGLLLRLPWRAWVCHCEARRGGGAAAWVARLWQHQVLRGVGS